MKRLFYIIFLFSCGLAMSQSEYPFYEQIAFDFYQSEIIDSFPVKRKIKFNPYISSLQRYYVFDVPTCFGFSSDSVTRFNELKPYIESQWDIDSNQFELDVSGVNKKKFRILRRNRDRYPKLYMSKVHVLEDDNERIFLNLYESEVRKEVIYHFELTRDGKIVDWCREEYYILILS